MATSTTKKTTSTTSKSAAAKAAPTTEAKEVTKVEKIVPKDVDLYQLIPVVNGFYGRLVYISPKSGERYVWEEFGDIQEIELRELRNIKSSAKGFFENNWFTFDEEYEWVIGYLGVGQYYKNALNNEEFLDLLNNDVDTVVDAINSMSKGQKNSFTYLVRNKVINMEIDSMKMISALEKALNTELIEK